MPRKALDPAIYGELRAEIETYNAEPRLLDPEQFVIRENAWRFIEKRVMRRIEAMMQNADKGEKRHLRVVKRQAHAIRTAYDELNEQLYAAFRARIGTATPDEIRAQWRSYVEPVKSERWADPPRYDHLDTFFDGVLHLALWPRPQRVVEMEMVQYQPTPARIILDMIERLDLGAQDVFYDIGSGLGRVPMAADLTSAAQVKGVEFEPAYTEWSRRHADKLGIARTTFITADARDVPYDDATVVFLYTPFKGKILQRMIEILRSEGRRRPLRICTYGPGTFDLMKEGGFRSLDDPEPTVNRVAILVVDDDAPPRTEPPGRTA